MGLFTHHIKISYRSLRKYKTQNIISILGLTIGFVCFAFSALWIRFEMSYDNFHQNADRIFRVNIAPFKWYTDQSRISDIHSAPYLLANWLKTNFPEIENAGTMSLGRRFTDLHNFPVLFLDHGFSNIFNLNLPESFFIRGQPDRPVAIIHELNNEGIVGYIKEQFNWDVQLTIPRWPTNTNIPFDIAVPFTNVFNETQLNNWHLGLFDAYVLIHKGTNVRALKEKLSKIEIPERDTPVSLILTPITQLRYNDPTGRIQPEIKFVHIQIFALAGLLIILSALFNHLTLYVTKVRMRLRELALRKVHGATDRQIAATLYTDFLSVILLSLLVSFALMVWLLPTFKEYATIGSNNVSIYAELLVYAVLLIVCSVIVCSISVLYFRKQLLSENIKGSVGLGLRKGSLFVQLIISLVMMFCAAVFIKQIRFLQDTDLGINRRNVAAVSVTGIRLAPPFADRIRQIPGIIDALPIMNSNFLRQMTTGSISQSYVVDGEERSFNLLMLPADARFFDFFEIEIIDGTVFANEHNPSQVVVNEAVMRRMENALLSGAINRIGVARDFYLTPTARARPTQIFFPSPAIRDRFGAIAYRYKDGHRQQTEQAITQWLREEFPERGEFVVNFTYMEDIFEEYFSSERALLTLLSIMALAGILIAIFGVYSLTSLTCRQRRKEIAIRKVHGAEVVDIVNIFFKEYLILLAVAALVAFPTGFLIMKRWLENYVKQTSMDAWLFVTIFLVVFLLIVLSIVSMVWKAANRNPATEVMKSE